MVISHQNSSCRTKNPSLNPSISHLYKWKTSVRLRFLWTLGCADLHSDTHFCYSKHKDHLLMFFMSSGVKVLANIRIQLRATVFDRVLNPSQMENKQTVSAYKNTVSWRTFTKVWLCFLICLRWCGDTSYCIREVKRIILEAADQNYFSFCTSNQDPPYVWCRLAQSWRRLVVVVVPCGGEKQVARRLKYWWRMINSCERLKLIQTEHAPSNLRRNYGKRGHGDLQEPGNSYRDMKTGKF